MDCISEKVAYLIFQLTTSRGGRHYYAVQQVLDGAFQLTTSRGGRLAVPTIPPNTVLFQLTTSRGGRLICRLLYLRLFHFNSRPHEEVDVTISSTKQTFIFQLTTSRGGRLYIPNRPKRLTYFNSRPHEEVDVGWSRGVSEAMAISTHDLTRRSTRSQWERRNEMGYFNSRPHEEVDNLRLAQFDLRGYFNSRPHEEVDLLAVWGSLNYAISTHDLTRRSTFFIHRTYS